MERERGVLRVRLSEAEEFVAGATPAFPKYTTQLLNLANQTAQGTRPKVVGQMSELIPSCPEGTYWGWVKWYESTHPNAIRQATARIWEQIQKYGAALQLITPELVEVWVRDLVLTKTFVGLKTQDVVLEVLSRALDLEPVKHATPADEAKGVDGYLGETPVSVKPETYRSKALPEQIVAPIVYYEKRKNSLVIDVRELLAAIHRG